MDAFTTAAIAPGESGGVPGGLGGLFGGGNLIAGLQFAGPVIQGLGQQRQFQAQASVAGQNAAIAEARSRAEADREARASRRRLGRIRAQAGASGTTLSGSVLDVLSDQAAEEELNRLLILFEGDAQARRDRFQASSLRGRGRQTLLGGVTQGAINTLPRLIR